MTTYVRGWSVAMAAGFALACGPIVEPDYYPPGVYVLTTVDGRAGAPFVLNDAQCGGRRTIDLIVADTLFLAVDGSARRVVVYGGRSFRDGVEQPVSPSRPIDFGDGRFGRDARRGVWLRFPHPVRKPELDEPHYYRERGRSLVDQLATGVRCPDGSGTPIRDVDAVYTPR
jgi:hypothetical protein